MCSDTIASEDAERRSRILNDPDFVCAPAYSNSLARIKQAHPEGVPDKHIARYLLLTEQDLQSIYQNACAKIRRYLQI